MIQNYLYFSIFRIHDFRYKHMLFCYPQSIYIYIYIFRSEDYGDYKHKYINKYGYIF